MNNVGYLIKLPNEDKYWNSEAREFVKLNDLICPTLMDIDSAKKFAIDFGIESKTVYKICNKKGVVLKKYSDSIEKQIIKYFSF